MINIEEGKIYYFSEVGFADRGMLKGTVVYISQDYPRPDKHSEIYALVRVDYPDDKFYHHKVYESDLLEDSKELQELEVKQIRRAQIELEIQKLEEERDKL